MNGSTLVSANKAPYLVRYPCLPASCEVVEEKGWIQGDREQGKHPEAMLGKE